MVPGENKNNAHAKFGGQTTESIMVFGLDSQIFRDWIDSKN